MAQSDRPNREPIPITPSSRKVQDNEASVATFLDYLEAFYESLENSLEELERWEQSYEKKGSLIPTELIPIRVQYEGTYGWGINYFFLAMGNLIELLYMTMRKGAQAKHQARFLTEGKCLYLFIGIATQAGFANTLLVNFTNLSFVFDNRKGHSPTLSVPACLRPFSR